VTAKMTVIEFKVEFNAELGAKCSAARDVAL
jgi:hypothetical protein